MNTIKYYKRKSNRLRALLRNKEKVWITADHRILPLGALTDEHLCNILNSFRLDKMEDQIYQLLVKEANERGLKWGRFKGVPLRDGDLQSAGYLDRGRVIPFTQWKTKANYMVHRATRFWLSKHQVCLLSEVPVGYVFIREYSPTLDELYMKVELPPVPNAEFLAPGVVVPCLNLKTGKIIFLFPQQTVLQLSEGGARITVSKCEGQE